MPTSSDLSLSVTEVYYTLDYYTLDSRSVSRWRCSFPMISTRVDVDADADFGQGGACAEEEGDRSWN